MKKNFAALAPYGIILAIDFYLLPFWVKNTGTAMLLMLCIMPLTAFVSAVIYGARSGFSILLSITALLLFLPTLFIYYNSTAWVYAIAYAVIVLAGTGIGSIFYQKR